MRLGSALALVVVMLPGVAFAADTAAAESLFQEGLRFKSQQNYAEACKRFERSQALAPAVGTLLNLGECHEQQHEIAQSWLAYRQALTLADTTGDARADRARREAARLEPRVPHLTISASPEGPSVTRDGMRVEPAALNAAIAIDPGHHVVAASASGRKPWQKEVDLAEGQSVTVTVPELEAAAAPSSRRAIGVGLEIGGGALLTGGFVAGAIALIQWRSVEHACPNAGCAPGIAQQEQDNVDTARMWATIGTIGIISGAAILAGGVALHLTSPASESRVSIAPTLGGLGLAWRR